MTQDFSKITIRTKPSTVLLQKLGWMKLSRVLFSKKDDVHLAYVRQHYHAAYGTGGGRHCNLSSVKFYKKKHQSFCYVKDATKEIDSEFYNEIMNDLERIIDKCKVEKGEGDKNGGKI